jgi:GAF domain-containing protein
MSEIPERPGKRRAEAEMLASLEEVYRQADPLHAAAADVVARMIGPLLAGLGADVGFVATLARGGRTLEVARITPHSQTPVRLAFPADAPYPLAVAVRRKEPLFIESNEQLACDHPGLVRVQNEDHACATLPLLAGDGRLLGALNLGFEEPHEFSDEERRRIETLGRRCAETLAELES